MCEYHFYLGFDTLNSWEKDKNQDSVHLKYQKITQITHSRYGKRGEQKKLHQRSLVKFDGFKDNDDIIINPEFGQSLKASLKASKRRLMLFIDNNDQLNYSPKKISQFNGINY